MAHRIDAPGHVGNKFVEPNTGTGAPGTDIGAEWLTDMQENVVQTVEAAGLTPVKGTDALPTGYGQLAEAVRILAGRGAGAGFKNQLVNGGFDYWRRQLVSPPSWTLVGAAGAYTADCWFAQATVGGTSVVSRQDLGVGLGAQARSGRYALRFNQTVGGLGPFLEQRLEGLEKYDNQKVTVSFDAKVSASTIALQPYIQQNFGVGGSGTVEVTGTSKTITTTKQRFTHTFDVPSIGGKTLVGLGYLAIGFRGPGSSTFTLDISAVQLEYGPSATEFEAVDPAAELLRCMRHFFTTYPLGTALFTITTNGCLTCDESGSLLDGLNKLLPVPMRTTPASYWVSPRSGAVFKVERPIGADANVSNVFFGSEQTSGAPETGTVVAGQARAHLILDAGL